MSQFKINIKKHQSILYVCIYIYCIISEWIKLDMYVHTYILRRNEKFQLEKYTVENFHLTITFLMNLIKLNFENDILLEIKSILHRKTSDCS